MPSTGTLAAKMAGLAAGAAPSITEAGPPDSTMALGANCSILAWSTDWKGWISQYTPASRRRRAISWVTWEPKSTISKRSDMRRYKESGPPVQLASVWIIATTEGKSGLAAHDDPHRPVCEVVRLVADDGDAGGHERPSHRVDDLAAGLGVPGVQHEHHARRRRGHLLVELRHRSASGFDGVGDFQR